MQSVGGLGRLSGRVDRRFIGADVLEQNRTVRQVFLGQAGAGGTGVGRRRHDRAHDAVPVPLLVGEVELQVVVVVMVVAVVSVMTAVAAVAGLRGRIAGVE